jgi:AcrR family transcriptional regulator
VRPRSEAPARILEAAIDVIESGGEVAIRVHDLANSCGVTGPILYRAFGSREGLIEAAQTERYRRSLLELDVIIESMAGCTTAEALHDALHRAVDQALGDRNGRRVRANIIGSSITRPALAASIAALHRSTIDRIATAWQTAQSNGLLRPGTDLRALAAWWLGQLDSRVHLELSAGHVDDAAWDDIARRSLVGALLA